LLIFALLIWALSACNGVKPEPVSQAPEGTPQVAAVAAEVAASKDGATLMNERCSVCHGALKVMQARKTAEQWNQTVNRMIGKGAHLTETEKTILLEYLGKNLAP
jgi:cytochrome c5